MVPVKQYCCCCQSLSCTRLFTTPWTIACQALQSMGFPKQEYWSELPFSSLGDFSNPGIEPEYLALARGYFTTEPPDKYQEQLLRSLVMTMYQNYYNPLFIYLFIYLYYLPWSLRQKRIHLQCKKPGFALWVRKIPWRREW